MCFHPPHLYQLKHMTMPTFDLHPRLAIELIQLPLCRVLLMNDAQYPWLILVPQRAGLREIFELSSNDQIQLIHESSMLSRLMHSHFKADKMNIAALGNLVPQLHIHHIARYTHDPAWPAPVFGVHTARPYSHQALAEQQITLQALLRAQL